MIFFNFKLQVTISAILFVILITAIPLYVKYRSKNKIFTVTEHLEVKEFAIILGAGIIDDKTPSIFLEKRLKDALTLITTGKVKKLLLSGDNSSVSYDEISVMNNYLLRNGVAQDLIFADYAGFDTYSSMERAKEIFGVEKAIVVSQGYHLPRAIFIAQYKGLDVIGFTSNSKYGRNRYYIREWAATIKSVIDCLTNRKAKYYGEKINTNGKSNVELKQL